MSSLQILIPWFVVVLTLLLANPVRSETLTYDVHYLGLRVGKLVLQRYDSLNASGSRLRVVDLLMETRGIYGALFKVRNRYHVVYDPKKLTLLRVRKSIVQSNVSHNFTIDYSNSTALLQGDGVKRSWFTEGPVLEVVSLLDLVISSNRPDTTFTVPLDQEGVETQARVRCFRKKGVHLGFAIVSSVRKNYRSWKTDILTNRFSKPGAHLEVRFSSSDAGIPEQIKYSLGPATATAKIREIR